MHYEKVIPNENLWSRNVTDGAPFEQRVIQTFGASFELFRTGHNAQWLAL